MADTEFGFRHILVNPDIGFRHMLAYKQQGWLTNILLYGISLLENYL